MPRLIYALLFYLAQPLVWLRLLWRARKQPALSAPATPEAILSALNSIG